MVFKTTAISNYTLNIGLGLPANRRNHSYINVGYSYRRRGQINNGLIRETYHTITLNFSLNDLWLKKEKLIKAKIYLGSPACLT